MAGKKKSKKLFVLDTNVILHDSTCIHKFDEHDIVVPISVIEELDHFKKGNGSLNYHAREFVRALDAVSGEKIFNGGISLGPDLGKITIRLERPMHEDLSITFSPSKVDHQILNIAYHLTKEFPAREIIMVSKDVNLRMKAKSIGIRSEDYKNDQVKNASDLYSGYQVKENVPGELINKLFNGTASFELSDYPEASSLSPNEYIVLRNCTKSALAVFDPVVGRIRRVDKKSSYGVMPRNAEQTFVLDALTNSNVQLVTITGKAGTGKTLLALAAALKEQGNYRQVFMSRPVVPLSNKDIGYLPGDIESKLDPYMQPMYDNLGVLQLTENAINGGKKISELLDQKILVVAPLQYIRGRSLVKIFFIVDEAQNLTPHEVKTIITRAGEGTKVVLTGDIFQIDHPYLDTQSNGLSYIIEKMHGQNLYAHINLEKGERSELAELASNLL